MCTKTPDITQTGFLGLLGTVLTMHSEQLPFLGGSIPCAAQPGEPRERIQNAVRVWVQMEGRRTCAISVLGKRTDVESLPGQCIFLAPNAWAIEMPGRDYFALGIALEQHFVRLVQLGTEPHDKRTSLAYHTALPLGGAGLLAARSLSALAEEGNREDGARELVIALLRLLRRHLLDDAPSSSNAGRAKITWRATYAYLEENYARPLTRESVGEALNLHPNYLSALARQEGGQSFHEALETIRMRHVQRFLRETDIKVLRIAMLCGYGDARSLAKAFHRVFGATPSEFRRRRG